MIRSVQTGSPLHRLEPVPVSHFTGTSETGNGPVGHLNPDTMVAPLTPKPTRKVESLPRSPPTIVSGREEDGALKEVVLSRYRCANYILETKTKVGSTTAKAPAPRTNPNINESPTTPKSHTHPPHECDGRSRDPESLVVKD